MGTSPPLLRSGPRTSCSQRTKERVSQLQHPDKNDHPDATTKFQRINNAYERLTKVLALLLPPCRFCKLTPSQLSTAADMRGGFARFLDADLILKQVVEGVESDEDDEDGFDDMNMDAMFEVFERSPPPSLPPPLPPEPFHTADCAGISRF